MEAGPNNETRILRKLWSEQKENMERLGTLNGDESFYHPLVRKLWSDDLRRQAEYLKDLSPVLYNLGDENFYTYDAGFGESDKQPFADFLRQKYQTMENLNLEYGASYAGFGEVPHLRLDAAKKREIWSLTMTTGNILKKCTWTCIISWRRKSKRFIPEPG